MATAESEQWLQAGITSARSGNRTEARSLLLQVIEADEQNQKAWLWLSGVVDSDEERRICLENVLTLDPDNEAAQRGLAALDQGVDGGKETAVESIIIRKEKAPFSAASAVLYPEKQVQEWEWRDPTPAYKRAEEVGYQADSRYDDVWAREAEICAYCAAELADESVKQCPGCRRNLSRRAFRYQKPSSNMHLLWVALAGLGQLYMLQALYDLAVTRSLLAVVMAIVLMIAFLALAMGVYLRRTSAYLASIVVLGLLLFTAVLGALLPIDVTVLESFFEGYDPAVSNVAVPLAAQLGGALRAFQVAAAALALFLAIFKVSADFERVDGRQVAQISKGVSLAADYHMLAKRFMKEGKLATAVLHWQRAAAKAPQHLLYQRQLGLAYARLGFYGRSLDILNAAYKIAVTPEKQADIQKLIKAVTQRQAATAAAAAEEHGKQSA